MLCHHLKSKTRSYSSHKACTFLWCCKILSARWILNKCMLNWILNGIRTNLFSRPQKGSFEKLSMDSPGHIAAPCVLYQHYTSLVLQWDLTNSWALEFRLTQDIITCRMNLRAPWVLIAEDLGLKHKSRNSLIISPEFMFLWSQNNNQNGHIKNMPDVWGKKNLPQFKLIFAHYLVHLSVLLSLWKKIINGFNKVGVVFCLFQE